MSKLSVEEIVTRYEQSPVRLLTIEEIDDLIASWRERGEALKKIASTPIWSEFTMTTGEATSQSVYPGEHFEISGEHFDQSSVNEVTEDSSMSGSCGTSVAFVIAEAKAEEANRCADILSAKADQYDAYVANILREFAGRFRMRALAAAWQPQGGEHEQA